ncbi:adenylate/guanylate cyclase domain-containing protein [Sedimentitalea todarodis]|uniref:Adenylate/guanylate cyclase domain-containing protein n=1 Tax=Sedimentitalea todarodis TaxID=1631240 RepID=A0ABU3VL88_9RHOB|nr:adenylate/guanylate cyclase domain-containing protein [Sedimentitalea todarodis]MDU9006942.1 adenylate/guanylate cyclase domain-containing protein [Sedimentitalea todarodis]
MERGVRAILVADVVESIRLVELDEEGTIQRWQDLLKLADSVVFSRMHGRIVKTLGDGVLVEFKAAREAVAAAKELHALVVSGNEDISLDKHIMLRIGIDFDNVILQSEDVLGRGVNRAARLMSLANPGETIVSSGVRDSLTDAVDGMIEDLGECFLRHYPRPLRAFRIASTSNGPQLPPGGFDIKLRPVLAIVPFQPTLGDEGTDRTGDVVSEEIIRIVSRSSDIAVVSRLSTAALSARLLTISEMASLLKADYILSGFYCVDRGIVMLDAELAESGSETIIWADKFEVPLTAILGRESSPCDRIAAGLFGAITLNELSISRKRPLPTLKSYTLLLSAVELMHHLSPVDYQQSRRLLEALIDRSGRQAVPLAWMANWHVLRVIQGWSEDLEQDTNLAMRNCETALDSDPECELALAMDGFANLHLKRRFDIAESRFDDALQSNPSCAIARLLKGTMYAFSDRGDLAVKETENAISLSPLDPHRFIFETHCAGAHLSAGNFQRAEELARMAYRSNRRHASALRILTVALWELDRRDEAHEAARALLKIEPDLTKDRYLKRSPNSDFKIGRRIADVLQLAGIPA